MAHRRQCPPAPTPPGGLRQRRAGGCGSGYPLPGRSLPAPCSPLPAPAALPAQHRLLGWGQGQALRNAGGSRLQRHRFSSNNTSGAASYSCGSAADANARQRAGTYLSHNSSARGTAALAATNGTGTGGNGASAGADVGHPGQGDKGRLCRRVGPHGWLRVGVFCSTCTHTQHRHHGDRAQAAPTNCQRIWPPRRSRELSPSERRVPRLWHRWVPRHRSQPWPCSNAAPEPGHRAVTARDARHRQLARAGSRLPQQPRGREAAPAPALPTVRHRALPNPSLGHAAATSALVSPRSVPSR